MGGDIGEAAHFDMTLNDDVICSTIPDHSDNGDSDWAAGSCSAAVDVVAGKCCSDVVRICVKSIQ